MKVYSLYLFTVCAQAFFGQAYSVDPVPAVSESSKDARRAALEKELADLKQQRAKYAHWSRYANREAFRLQDRDWVEYQEYLRMEARAQRKLDEIDARSAQVQRELDSLLK